MSVEDLEHFHLPVPVHVELGHSAVQTHQNATRLLERAHVAANQLVGDSVCECLEGEEMKKMYTGKYNSLDSSGTTKRHLSS